MTNDTNISPSDRQILVAIFDLLGSLSEKLTGSRPIVSIGIGDNGFVCTTHSVSKVQWNSPDSQARSSDLQESNSILP